MKKRFLLPTITVLLAFVIFCGCTSNNTQTEEITLTPSSNLVLGGNLTYPGFYAWEFDLQKGDLVELTVQASYAVNLYVVPDSAHQIWANAYYHTEKPGLYYPDEQALEKAGQTLSTILTFTAPTDGRFDLVALNTYHTSVTVSVSGKIRRNI